MQLRILFLPNILQEYVHASVECGQNIQQKWNSFCNQDGISFLPNIIHEYVHSSVECGQSIQ